MAEEWFIIQRPPYYLKQPESDVAREETRYSCIYTLRNFETSFFLVFSVHRFCIFFPRKDKDFTHTAYIIYQVMERLIISIPPRALFPTPPLPPLTPGTSHLFNSLTKLIGSLLSHEQLWRLPVYIYWSVPHGPITEFRIAKGAFPGGMILL